MAPATTRPMITTSRWRTMGSRVTLKASGTTIGITYTVTLEVVSMKAHGWRFTTTPVSPLVQDSAAPRQTRCLSSATRYTRRQARRVQLARVLLARGLLTRRSRCRQTRCWHLFRWPYHPSQGFEEEEGVATVQLAHESHRHLGGHCG